MVVVKRFVEFVGAAIKLSIMLRFLSTTLYDICFIGLVVIATSPHALNSFVKSVLYSPFFLHSNSFQQLISGQFQKYFSLLFMTLNLSAKNCNCFEKIFLHKVKIGFRQNASNKSE